MAAVGGRLTGMGVSASERPTDAAVSWVAIRDLEHQVRGVDRSNGRAFMGHRSSGSGEQIPRVGPVAGISDTPVEAPCTRQIVRSASMAVLVEAYEASTTLGKVVVRVFRQHL
jgi:hypothetical protein